MQALVIGAGPAGLMAADALAAAGAQVTLAEAKPSVGRKFLMAGKSGLNLTKDEPGDRFAAHYEASQDRLAPMLAAFGPDAVQDWARGLGQEVFTGSTGRVFPGAMKASPLLRAWLARLDGLGVDRKTRWRWTGTPWVFDTPEGPQRVDPDVVVLALGGASWARLGSDGRWAPHLAAQGVATVPFAPMNVGIAVRWSDHMRPHFGAPLKGLRLSAGGKTSSGEVVLSARGLEGGGLYPLSKPLRAGAPLVIDLLPDLSVETIRARLEAGGKDSIGNRLRKGLRLDPAKRALVQELARPLPADPAPVLKALTLHHDGPRPLDEAISTSGGIAWEALDEGLMLTAMPGVFCAGEMIDWDAPTGGYLITACLATGLWAGRAAAAYAAAAAR